MAGPDFPGRIKRLRILMEERGLDACLVGSESDILYYTGAEAGDSFLLVPAESRPTLFVTSLNNQVESTGGFRAVFIKGASDVAKRLRFRKTGFDEFSTSYAVFSRLRKSGTRLIPSASAIKEPRMVKEGWEMEQIAKAAKLAKKAMSCLSLRGTESDIADSIDFSIRKAGARNSFDTIVASGKNSAFVHHKPARAPVKQKGLVIVDLGARLNFYCSDMTRTFCRRPGPREKTIMENIAEIQSELIGMARDGAKYDDIGKRHETLLKRKGYKVMHSFGHGIGLSVHERPSKGDILKAGTVLTVEPGAYIRNFGGCRLEDMVAVGKGKARILTRD